MSIENKRLVRDVIEEIFNQKKPCLFALIYTRDCRGQSPDGPLKGHDGFTLFLERYKAAFPDFRLDIDYMVAEKNLVVAHYTFAGTNTGALAGFPPTGCAVRVPGMMVSHIVNNRISHQSFIWDNLEPRRQVRGALVAERRWMVRQPATSTETPQEIKTVIRQTGGQYGSPTE